MKKTDSDITEYHKNFIAGIRYLMANLEMETMQEAANYIGLPKLSLYKIMDGSNRPTADQGIILCQKGGFSANWMFLNSGSQYIAQIADFMTIQKDLKEIKKLIGK